MIDKASFFLGRDGQFFILTGIICALLYGGLMALLIDVVGLHETVGAAISFFISTIVSYLGNSIFSFESHLKMRQAIKFACVTLAGLLLNVVIAFVVGQLGGGYILITMAVFITVPPLNFTLHKIWTFR